MTIIDDLEKKIGEMLYGERCPFISDCDSVDYDVKRGCKDYGIACEELRDYVIDWIHEQMQDYSNKIKRERGNNYEV